MAELGRESVVRMPVIELDEVRKGLRGTAIVNGSPCIWDIRMVKTPAEVARIRHICQIVSAGFEALPDKLRIGDSEADACRKLRLDCALRGADATPFMPGVMSWPSEPSHACTARLKSCT